MTRPITAGSTYDGAWLKARKAASGLTWEEIAVRVGTGVDYLKVIAADKTRLTVEMRRRIEEAISESVGPRRE